MRPAQVHLTREISRLTEERNQIFAVCAKVLSPSNENIRCKDLVACVRDVAQIACGKEDLARAESPAVVSAPTAVPHRPTDAPRCEKHGVVMCQRFNYTPINPVASLATPNGTYSCIACDGEQRRASTARR